MTQVVLTKDIKIDTATGNARLQLYVKSSSDNMPTALFVYQRQATEIAGVSMDAFVHVASYADLAEYAENVPETTDVFFRKYYVDLAFRNTEDLFASLQSIQDAISSLCKTWTKLETTSSTPEDITIEG